MNFNIEEELKKLPGKPGVYLMHDETDAIIYVGKATSVFSDQPEQGAENRADGDQNPAV